MIRTIFSFSLCLFSLIVWGQTVICNRIDFELTPIAEEETAFVDFKYLVHVKMNLSVSDMKNDTLRLKTEVKIGQGLEPKNLNAYLINDNEEKRLLPSFVENITDSFPFRDVQYLNIVLTAHQNANLIVSYDVLGSGLLFYLFAQNYPTVFAFHPQYEFIYPIKMPIQEVRASAPDNLLTFCCAKNRDGIHKGEVNVTYIEKHAFKKESIEEGNLKLNIYLPDSTVDDTAFRRRVDRFYTLTKQLATHVKTPKNLDVIILNWRDEASKNAFGMGLGNYCVFDIKFPADGMLHELIHLAMPCEVSDMSDGEYFVKESIVEWLALFLSGEVGKIDLSLLRTADPCLYNIHINHLKTRKSIYHVGPAILQKIAIEAGEDLLASTIISFFTQNEGRETNYAGLIQHFYTYLPRSLVEELDAMVKGE